MRALLALRLITYLLVFAGVGALALAGLLAPLGTAIVALALLGNWCIDQARERLPVRPTLGWALIVTAAIAIVLDLFYLAQTILDGMVHLLLFLILLRLFRRRSLKDRPARATDRGRASRWLPRSGHGVHAAGLGARWRRSLRG